MASNLTRYDPAQPLARRVRRELHEPAEQMQYIVAVAEAAHEQVGRIYSECNDLTVTTLVRAHALIQAAALAGVPEAALQQLEGMEVDFAAAMRHTAASGAARIAMFQAQVQELSEPTPLDVFDRWLKG